MVKNTKGGSGSKSLSRKSQKTFVNTSDSILKPSTPFEFFAMVTHFFGNTATVVDVNNKSFRCFIRGKFTGRNKRNFIVAPGKLVLVSKRDFESESANNVDLLTVYDSHDISILINLSQYNIYSLLTLYNNSTNNTSAQEDIVFDSNYDDSHRDNNLQDTQDTSTATTNNAYLSSKQSNDYIDFDSI